MAWTNPRSWITGEVLTAALLNLHLRDNLLAIGDPGAWTAYTPTTGGVTSLSNGTVSGRYKQVGKATIFTAVLTIGTTTTLGGTFTLGLPFAGSSTGPYTTFSGIAYRTSTNTAYFAGGGLGANATFASPYSHGTTQINLSTPFAWGAGDSLTLSGTYEAA